MVFAAGLLLVGGCGLINDSVPEEPEPEKETVSLNVQFYMLPNFASANSLTRSGIPLTRTDPEGHPETPSDYLYEDAIDISSKDLAIYAFDESGNCTFNSKNTTYDTRVLGSASTGYLVNTYIGDFKNDRIADNVTFTIVVLANLESAGGRYYNVNPEETPFTISQFEAFIADFNLPCNNMTGWYPGEKNADGKTAFIPMYGKRTFIIPKTHIFGDPNNPSVELFEIGSIPLLRALAKVEIIDAIGKEEGSHYPGITNVSISGFRSNGCLIPRNFVYGQQVTDITLPTDKTIPDKAWPMKQLEGEKTIAYDNAGNDIKKKVKFWRIYIPEQSLAIEGTQPAFSLTIQSAESPMYILHRQIELVNYAGAYSNRIMRNHIYGIAVTGLSATGSLLWTVCPMDKTTVNIPVFN